MISYQITDDQFAKVSSGGVVYRLTQGSEPKFAVLVRNPNTDRNPTDQSTYHLPKGTLESGETLEQNAEREITEETGVKVGLRGYLGASVLPLRREKQPPLRDRDGNEICIHYFVAEYTADSEDGMDHEHDTVLWLTADEAVEKLEGYWKHEDEFIHRAVKWLEAHESAE